MNDELMSIQTRMMRISSAIQAKKQDKANHVRRVSQLDTVINKITRDHTNKLADRTEHERRISEADSVIVRLEADLADQEQRFKAVRREARQLVPAV